ncbi:hypothetical protein HG536_0H03860 [Torulaspora globosa]|uniref:Glutathione hydrolase n=1 Tax=Torulaspora globosa TaxID=48254 RepID=A0A7G3ZNC4_9SACH|nr:uncharacterized protein HG536_0H03860 [Torulaspora globosa]QLL35010.1 hypothetical protein HG536_0H03860 [Torulaspora globosa]
MQSPSSGGKFLHRRIAAVILSLISILSVAQSHPVTNFVPVRPDFGSFEKLDSGHNIEIDPLRREPTLNPDKDLLKIGRHGGISSDLQLCSNLTIEKVLQKFPGSNAADAAVTQALCIGMINFFNSGVGGGGYAVFSGKQEKDHLFVDFREQAPAGSHKQMFDECPDCSKVGGLAVGVPGELKGLYELHKSRGSGQVAWADLVTPVAELGYEGWEIGAALGASLEKYEPLLLQMTEDWSFVINSTGNGVKKAGDWIQRPALSDTLMELAKNGSAEPFYDPNHWVARSIVKSIGKHGGILTKEDLANYTVSAGKPLSLKIRSGYQYAPNNDLTVLTSSGSSSGAALISALSIMDQMETVEGGDYMPLTSFQLIEAMKWMGSARSRLGDYDGDEIPAHIKEVLGKEWIDNAAGKIKQNCLRSEPKTFENWTWYNPAYEINEPHGTAHFSIVDGLGNAVSLTTTINLLFGSLVHDPVTGVIFNNEMDDFSQPHRSNSFGLAASIYNYPSPGRRPLSSAVPSIILNELGIPDLVVGASGGSTITTSVLQAIVRSYWYNMPLLETIAYPRVHHQLLPDVLEVENYSMVGKSAVGSFNKMGYSTQERGPRSVVNAIRYFNGDWHAVSDYWRKRGVSSVY